MQKMKNANEQVSLNKIKIFPNIVLNKSSSLKSSFSSENQARDVFANKENTVTV